MQGLQPSVVLAIALAWSATASEAQTREPVPLEPPGRQPALVAEQDVHAIELLSASGLSGYPVTIRKPGASFVKLHFSDFRLPQGVVVLVSNPSGSEVYRYGAQSRDGFTVDRTAGDDGETRFSAMSISGDTALVRLAGSIQALDPQHHGIEIDFVLKGQPESAADLPRHEIEKKLGLNAKSTQFACGVAERLDAVCWEDQYPDQYDRSRPVAKLVTSRGFQCTAWRVGNDNRLFTAEHCITSQDELQGTEIWFNYEATSCGSNSKREAVKVSGDQLLAADQTLDYALFTVHNFEAVKSFGNLGLDVRKGSVGENIFIPQHGLGLPRQISLESDMNVSGLCEIDDTSVDAYGDGTDIGYFCDTTTSSSGSPVVSSSTGKVIALHHLGGCLNMGTKVSLIWPQVKSHFGGVVPRGDSKADWAPANRVPEANYFAECDKLSCNFNAIESTDSDGSISSYAWDFGDGVLSNGQVVNHQFEEPGQFEVSLTVEDNEGARDTHTAHVEVTAPNQAPDARFSSACVDNHCRFNAGSSTDSDGEIEAWHWKLGDGSTASGREIEHRFDQAGAYTITLTVKDNEGAEDKSTHQVTVQMPNIAPEAKFEASCNEDLCVFDASGSGDSDGEITAYKWSFGDGSNARGIQAEHRFSQQGTFTVVLTVHDDRGKFSRVEQTIEIDLPNQAPIARFTVSCDELTCVFDAGYSTDHDGQLTSWDWSLDDGTALSGSRVVHDFTEDGSYTVSLTVTDDENASKTRTQTVSVSQNREIRLTVSAYTGSKGALASLKWQGAESQMVTIHRDGTPLAKADNSGSFTDQHIKHNRKIARYQVCEAPSGVCSEEITIRLKKR